MRGKKPTPIPSNETKAAPPAPPFLKGEAKKEWNRITALLATRRVLSDEDQAALVIYCTSWSQYRIATEKLAVEGEVIMSDRGIPVKNPWCTIQHQAWDKIRPLLSEFSLTPTARARQKLEDAGESDGDEFFE